MKTPCFAIVGAGQTAAWAIKTLRQQGFSDRIVLIGAEIHLPYERPPLSKQVLLEDIEPESIYVFPAKAYEDWDVDLELGFQVTGLDLHDSRIEMSNGRRLHYDRTLLSTGGLPRRLDVPGANLENVLYLRSIHDSLSIRRQLTQSAHVLIVGGGWIGLEIAAAARRIGTKVTVLEYAPRLCARAVPPQVSDLLFALHRDHGVSIQLNARLVGLEGAGRVERALFADGQSLDVSAVIVGIGLQPSTELGSQACLSIDNGIVVDESSQSSHPNIFAAGDVANFRSASGRRMRLESWENAQRQGIAAGNGMLGKPTPADPAPWFWSDQYEQNIQLVGEFDGYDETMPFGESAPDRGTTLFLRREQLLGAVAINAGRDIRVIKRFMQTGKTIDWRAIVQSKVPLHQALKA